MQRFLFPVIVILLCIAVCTGSKAIDVKDTRLVYNPAISKDHIAFIYANDLWVADIDGTNIRRLTADGTVRTYGGTTSSLPVFSPDGKIIAFSACRNGNIDVYIIPTEGGQSKRLTWHPDDDNVEGFTPDGQSVLFSSPRYTFNYRTYQFFTVPLKGGFETQLPLPSAFRGDYSPDGSKIAYNPLSEAFNEWKGYRGGTVSVIWIYDFLDKTMIKIPQPKERCNDVSPVWTENKIYFRSDRNGEFNIFSFDTEKKDIRKLTAYNDYPVLCFSVSNGKIIYEQAGYLHILDIESNKDNKLTLGIAADLPELRERYTKFYVNYYDISPTGARAVFEVRGDIVTVPAKKGDARNITNTPGVNERSPAWSPDGKSIAYFSDESGEYELHVKAQYGNGETQEFKLSGSGFYDIPSWSPDGKKIVYIDNSFSLYLFDVKTGEAKKITSANTYEDNLSFSWSPDSRWIAYTHNTDVYMQKICVYSLEKDKYYDITDGMTEASSPVFDESGKYLYFFNSTDAGPVKHWFELSNRALKTTNFLYMAILPSDLSSPFAKESDEEKGIQKDDKNKEKENTQKTTATSIDFEGLDNRIISFPIASGMYDSLQTGKEGMIYYMKYDSPDRWEDGSLYCYNLKERKAELITANIASYVISQNNEKILYAMKNSYYIIPAKGKSSDQGKLNIDIDIKVVPEKEWKQIYEEAWRINRDYFYDPNMHGVNWKDVKEKYSLFLPHLATRTDLNRVLQWMGSEVRVGHHRVFGGDIPDIIVKTPVGLLGADYVIENGLYRFKKIYGGLNWDPDLRSPLTEPGVNVKTGEYLLAVNGKKLTSDINIYSLFENTPKRLVEIIVGTDPSGKDSRTVTVVPIGNEKALRNRDWIEGNIKKVDKATGGRVAYVYVPDTSIQGYNYFRRYFFPQANKEAIIIDERYNGGGLYADYYIDLLKRKEVCYFATRYGKDLRVPNALIEGPKVMLINEHSASGGDLLPWTFRKFKLGKLIGKRTWGGLVGILGFPRLIDGGYMTAPNFAAWDKDKWIAENEGVPPDIEVEQNPADVMTGHDPQLEKAIEVIMKDLIKNPPENIERPEYPDKTK
jgi:tricorn protease